MLERGVAHHHDERPALEPVLGLDRALGERTGELRTQLELDGARQDRVTGKVIGDRRPVCTHVGARIGVRALEAR